jgi:hypothetical protein
MTRLSSHCEPLGLALLSLLALGIGPACERTRNLSFETATLAPAKSPRAPGVAVDPAPALPPPQPNASASSGLVVLTAPESEQADRALVETFFDAVTSRDAGRLERLFATGAKAKTGAKSTEVDAIDFWKSRLSRLDYSKLSGQSVYRRHAVEIYREPDLKVLGGDRQLPVNVTADQVAVRVPVHSPQTDKTRLFGDEIVFLLTPTEGGLRIVEVVEDFQLP